MDVAAAAPCASFRFARFVHRGERHRKNHLRCALSRGATNHVNTHDNRPGAVGTVASPRCAAENDDAQQPTNSRREVGGLCVAVTLAAALSPMTGHEQAALAYDNPWPYDSSAEKIGSKKFAKFGPTVSESPSACPIQVAPSSEARRDAGPDMSRRAGVVCFIVRRRSFSYRWETPRGRSLRYGDAQGVYTNIIHGVIRSRHHHPGTHHQ